jgi:conjugal transfer pilus assembly protein TraF
MIEKFRWFLCLNLLVLSFAPAFAQVTESAPAPIKTSDKDKDLGWHFYYTDPVPEKKPKEALPLPSAPAAPKGPPPMSVEWIKTNYPIIQQRAINSPTPQNLRAELFAQRVMLDKAEVYTRTREIVQSTDPNLQEGVRMPLYGGAATALAMQSKKTRDEAFDELSEKVGLIVFYDHACSFCRQSVTLVNYLSRAMPKLKIRVMARNTADPQKVPNLFDTIKVYSDEKYNMSERYKVTHWPTILMISDLPQIYMVSQGVVAYEELTRRILNISFQEGLLGEEWFEKVYRQQNGLINTAMYEGLEPGMEEDPVALINAVVDMIENSDGTLYQNIVESEKQKLGTQEHQ